MQTSLRFLSFILALTVLNVSAAASKPEDSVLAYFAAAKAGDEATFKGLVTDQIGAQAEGTFRQLAKFYQEGELRVSIVESVSTGSDTHEVKFRVEMESAGSKSSGTQTVQLVRQDGRWLLAKQGTTRSSADQVAADADGKKPQNYVDAYYAALNADDMNAVFALYSPGYYAAETNDLITGKPDAERLAFHTAWISRKTESHVIDHAQCGYHKNNAPGVYSVAVRVTLTDDYLLQRKAQGKVAMMKTGGSELCFKLVDGRWRITSKLKGE